MGTWLAGCATRTLDVEPGFPMDGYGSRTGGVKGMWDPLEANVLFLKTGVESALLVSLDLLAVDRPFVTCLQRTLSRDCGIDSRMVLVAASHTHAGPAGFRRSGARRSLPEWAHRALRRHVLSRTLEAVAEAISRAVPATLTVGQARVEGVATNRRDPEGPSDPTVTTVKVVSERGATLGLLWHYACHPTVLDARNRLLSSDLPGGVRRILRERMGRPIPVLFVNGAAADVSTRFTRRGSARAEVDRLASILAGGIRLHGCLLEPTGLAGCRDTVLLPAAPLPDPKEADRILAEAERAFLDAKQQGQSGPSLRLLEVRLIGARKRAALASTRRPSSYRAGLQVLALGELAFAAFPGELYAEQGLALVRSSPFTWTLVAGYAGDYLGYLTPATDSGGYEADSALVAPGAVDALLSRTRSMLEEVHQVCTSGLH